MRALRSAYAWCFAVAAALCIWQGRLINSSASFVSTPGEAAGPFKLILGGLALLLAVLFLLTGYSVLKQRASARGLALAASAALVFAGAGIFYGTYGSQLRIVNPAWIPILLGLAGLAVFWPPMPVAPPPAKSRPYRTLPGSGVNPWLNRIVLVGCILGGTGGVRLLAVWAIAHGLPRTFPPFFVPQVIGAILLVLAFHEAGHALAGALLRMKVIGFVVGPFYWNKAYGKWTFAFRTAGLLSFVGQTMVAPTTLENFRNRKALQVAAGPAASLVTGLAAVGAIFAARGHFWAPEWAVLALLASITTFVGIVNLVPFGSKTMYSDGAKLYQLLHDGPWAGYHRAMGAVSATQVTALRPRDYDIVTVEKADESCAQGSDAVFLHLCAYAYYLDSGRNAEAARAIEEAEVSCAEWAIEPTADWAAIFVFATALLRRDAAAARLWWARMESRKGYRFKESLWDARCALLLSENELDEAAEALKKFEAFANGLPGTGAGEAKKDHVGILRKALEEALTAQSAPVAP